MGDYEVVLRSNIVFILGGLILRSLACGHWTDFTQSSPFDRLPLMVIAWIMMLMGFIGLAAMIGGTWGATVMALFLLAAAGRDLFDNDDDDEDDDEY